MAGLPSLEERVTALEAALAALTREAGTPGQADAVLAVADAAERVAAMFTPTPRTARRELLPLTTVHNALQAVSRDLRKGPAT